MAHMDNWDDWIQNLGYLKVGHLAAIGTPNVAG